MIRVETEALRLVSRSPVETVYAFIMHKRSSREHWLPVYSCRYEVVIPQAVNGEVTIGNVLRHPDKYLNCVYEYSLMGAFPDDSY